MERKLLVVFGVTGVQGGSVIKSVLNDERAAKEFRIRAVTRNPTSAKAQALTRQGVECVKGDMNSVDELRNAVNGAYAVFAVTNYWESQEPDIEVQQGKNIADACKEAKVQHLVWSSLMNVTELTKGKFPNVDHFDSKAKVEEYIRSLGDSLPATFFMPGFYCENLMGMIHPNPSSEAHEYIFSLPIPEHTKIPLFAAGEDTGKFVKAILLKRDATLGKRVLAATAYYTCSQIVAEFTEVKPEGGRNAHFNQISPEAFKKSLATTMGLSERAQTESLENMQFMTDFGYFGGASLDESHAILDEKPLTWKEFVLNAPAFQSLK